ncbi:MAG: hypothetical protein Q7U79_09820, partial [Rhodoferax sp.]|nr:hypothetical protein [Rhodoferax sp.]
ACRHGLRSIEDCYSLNDGASKADMFTGWKEMDQYMRENKIEGVRATVAAAEAEDEIVEDPKPKTEAKGKSPETKPGSTVKAAAKSTDKPSTTKH